MESEIHYEGWLIKSPPTKRIWRAVSGVDESDSKQICVALEYKDVVTSVHREISCDSGTSTGKCRSFQHQLATRRICQ